MIPRPNRWAVSATLFVAVAAVALAQTTPQFQWPTGPTATATVGLPYSSSVSGTGGNPPYTYTINSGALPPGLSLSNTSTGAITGTPTTAGVFNFTVMVTDSTPLPTDPSSSSTGPDIQAAARRRTTLRSGNNGASGFSPTFTITVSAATPTAAGAPTSPWTLCLMIAGLAGIAFFHLRQTRRA